MFVLCTQGFPKPDRWLSPPPRPAGRPYFEIAILCALPVEADAVLSIFDEDWDENADGQPYDKAVGDPNAYTTGLVGRHNVVLAHLGNMGNVSSASAAASFRWSFPNIKLALIVGILGVVPFDPKETGITRKTERVLGNVIISEGIVQYDFGRQYSNRFVVKNTLRDAYGRPNLEIRLLLAKLKSKTYRKRLQQKMAEYLKLLEIKDGLEYKYPGKEFDLLFPLGYRHIADDKECDVCCDKSKPIKRTRLQQGLVNPMVHFGIVGSGNSVIKSSEDRDIIATANNLVGFEIEGSGVWDNLPCVIIKGACDYADSHKNKAWQPYAAATAAACMKAFLGQWVPPPQPGPPKSCKGRSVGLPAAKEPQLRRANRTYRRLNGQAIYRR